MEDTLKNVYQRAESYKFLSLCYFQPDEELIPKVADVALNDPFFAEMARHIPPAVELETLKVDHARLFVGPFKVLAPPYGSVYLEDNRMMGDSTIDVIKCYENEGLNVVVKDAPDHIAMELEFMYYLVVKELEAINDNNQQSLRSARQKQYSFLQVHLARWLPFFAENVLENAQTEFYRNLAHLSNVFVQNDQMGLQNSRSVKSHPKTLVH